MCAFLKKIAEKVSIYIISKDESMSGKGWQNKCHYIPFAKNVEYLDSVEALCVR